jgi:hypothetical protein
MNNKTHWETVYKTKSPQQVSWTQVIPKTSLDFIAALKLPKAAKIIDVGGGDSNLVDHLLALGYKDITVLDISDEALNKAKTRLGKAAKQVTWITTNITDFEPTTQYDLWHDRAAFHFLTSTQEIAQYQQLVDTYVKSNLIIGTFSKDGPKKCSGLDITQYSTADLCDAFAQNFKKIDCKTEDHKTPFDTLQNFSFCSFKKSTP